MPEIKNIVPHQHKINRHRRGELLGQQSKILWFTGLSGSGKSTIAGKVEELLHERGYATYLLDGDSLRMGLNSDLGFSAEDRRQNIRRTGEVARLFLDSGVIVIAALISPLKLDRMMVREMVGKDEFIEVFINCPLEVCEERDTKGLYKKARVGEIENFTGINAPFEPPIKPEIEIFSNEMSAKAAADRIVKMVLPKLQLED